MNFPHDKIWHRFVALCFKGCPNDGPHEATCYDRRAAAIAALEAAGKVPGGAEAFDFAAHLQRQREWSERTFGPGSRAAGVVDHIRKELREIEQAPGDLKEWIDVVILALDGAWRSGATPEQIIGALVAKQAKNEARTWPDWRTAPPDKAIEHDRAAEKPAPEAGRSACDDFKPDNEHGDCVNCGESPSRHDFDPMTCPPIPGDYPPSGPAHQPATAVTVAELKAEQAWITDYLASGGLFNPEMAKHDVVRDGLIRIRALLARLASERR